MSLCIMLCVFKKQCVLKQPINFLSVLAFFRQHFGNVFVVFILKSEKFAG